MLRISAGEFRSRQLQAPPLERGSRPYTQRVKESTFDLLRGWFEDARVLDLFAGVGTMGLEAVSRGAARVVMVERDRGVFRLLQRNIESLDCADRATAVNADALAEACLRHAPEPVDIVFIDPPYAFMEDDVRRGRVLAQIVRCRRLMADRAFVVLRSPLGPEDGDWSIKGFSGPEPHLHGRNMWVMLYVPAEGGDAE